MRGRRQAVSLAQPAKVDLTQGMRALLDVSNGQKQETAVACSRSGVQRGSEFNRPGQPLLYRGSE